LTFDLDPNLTQFLSNSNLAQAQPSPRWYEYKSSKLAENTKKIGRKKIKKKIVKAKGPRWKRGPN